MNVQVDIMDQGTDCCDILSNSVIPLRRGYIAVINRSQKDIQDNISIRQALLKEQSYFQSHPKYRNYGTKCGTSNLTRSLNQVLIQHIKECLPDIRNKVITMMNDVNVSEYMSVMFVIQCSCMYIHICSVIWAHLENHH